LEICIFVGRQVNTRTQFSAETAEVIANIVFLAVASLQWFFFGWILGFTVRLISKRRKLA